MHWHHNWAHYDCGQVMRTWMMKILMPRRKSAVMARHHGFIWICVTGSHGVGDHDNRTASTGEAYARCRMD